MRSAWPISFALALASLLLGNPPVAAQNGIVLDFEAGTQGFTGIVAKDGQLTPEPNAVGLVREKALVRQGEASLLYSYRVEANAMRSLVGEVKLGADVRSLRLWVHCSAATQLLLALREQDGSGYQGSYFVPRDAWSAVEVNLDELSLAENEKDENGKLDPDQITHFTVSDFTTILINLGGPILNAIPGIPGDRTLRLDDVRFSPEALPRSTGPVTAEGKKAFVVDHFETQGVRWTPIRVSTTENPPSFRLFPDGITLQVASEAAGPGTGKGPLEPGGKGLRFSYPRARGEAWALQRSLDLYPLSDAVSLRLHLRLSVPTLLIIQLKEKDGSEYNQVILPDPNTDWRTVELHLADLPLAENSNDENGRLDPGQIKELLLLDASAFLGDQAPTGPVTVDLDAVWFRMK